MVNGLSVAARVLAERGGHEALANRLGLQRALWDWSDPRDLETAVGDLADALGSDAYPSSAAFYANGLGGAYSAIGRLSAGHAAFAERVGLKRDARRWSDADLLSIVREVIQRNNLERYPTFREFVEAGLYGACQAISLRHGGHEKFSRVSGYPRTTVEKRSTRMDMVARVSTLVAELSLSRYPTQREFLDNACGALYQQIDDRFQGGHVAVADELGLRRATSPGAWTKEGAHCELVQGLAERLGINHYPTLREFREAGLYGTYQAISLLPGGHTACAVALGLSRLRRVPYSERALVDGVLQLVERLELNRYPSQKEFNEQGLSGIEGNIRRGVGHAAFARQLGLPRVSDRCEWKTASRRLSRS